MNDELPHADETPGSEPLEETPESAAAEQASPALGSEEPQPESAEDVDVSPGEPDESSEPVEAADEPAEEADEEDAEVDADSPEESEEDEESSEEDVARRAFVTQVLAGSIGAVVGLVPVLSGLIFFLDPLIRGGGSSGDATAGGSVQKDAEGFIKLPVARSLLPSDGTPQQVTVEDDLVDAWNKFPNVPIGSVWLLRSESDEVTAFSTICPHLGCAVEYRGARSDFYCPCHLSAFKLDGSKDNPIPPRDMDSLAVKPGMGEEIWVQYKSFRGGISEKVEV
jgi:menaquinol-cytochrome c reductase iron-sulfur subunit